MSRHANYTIKPEHLTGRECEVIRLVAIGLTTEQMAKHLSVSEKTLKTYLGNLFEKCYVSNRVQLARYAFAHGYAAMPTPDTVVMQVTKVGVRL